MPGPAPSPSDDDIGILYLRIRDAARNAPKYHDDEDIALLFARALLATEREACAQLADAASEVGDPHCCQPTARDIAAAIRARGVA